jgi:alpha-D-ribose 1-methylphosphonate 5-triphosphate synthase subunit PhnG
MPDTVVENDPNASRKAWMGVLARAEPDALEAAYETLSPAPRHAMLRTPETGLVMVQARANGTGQKFNAGEMTVTRCSVRLPGGTVGHAYVAGRSRRHAELAAIFDALLQDPDSADDITRTVIEPLRLAQHDKHHTSARKTAATKVDFFTMARGEDAR